MMEELYELSHTGKEVDDGITKAHRLSNSNLLDNWYFVNPVNQRGATAYREPGYTIDRWILAKTTEATGAGTITLTDTGLSFDGRGIENSTYFRQTFPADLIPDGAIVTLSLLIETISGTVRFGQYGSAGAEANSPGLHSYTFNWTKSTGQSNSVLLYIPSSLPSSTFIIKAVKLELGENQTLAHQDEGGNWVINELPDYGEQLARCQRYYQRIKNNSASSAYPLMLAVAASAQTLSGVVNLPVPMRAYPSILLSASGDIEVRNNSGSAWLSVTSISSAGAVGSADGYTIRGVNLSTSGATAGACYLANLKAGGYIDLIADL